MSEKQARVYQIPQGRTVQAGGDPAAAAAAATAKGQAAGEPQVDQTLARLLTSRNNCVSKLDLSDSSYACRASVVQMRSPDESSLVSFLATGSLCVHSLPRLRPLMESDFVPLSSQRVASSMRFSRNGHCLYQPSANQVCKFTINAQYRALVNEMSGSLYVAREMPEQPRANFFRSLFSVASSAASRQSERDELFGQSGAGKPPRTLAKHIGAPAALEKLKGAAQGTMGFEMRQAREGLDERGEKLGELEDRTLQMMNQADSYATAAHQLAQKFKDKKWYQF